MNLCIQFIIPFSNPPIAVPAEAETELEDCKGGFPHSEIAGSKGASASPALIAACHVLHRLSTPRHPSEALQRLIVSQQNPCMDCLMTGKKCHEIRCLVLLARRCLLEPDLKAYEGPVKFFLYNVNRRRPVGPGRNLFAIGSWWSQTGSNRRPHACKARALPTELWPLVGALRRAVGDRVAAIRGLVGPGRLELPTLRLSGVRSNHLSYGPMAARQPG